MFTHEDWENIHNIAERFTKLLCRVANALEERCNDGSYKSAPCTDCGCTIIPRPSSCCPACKEPHGSFHACPVVTHRSHR